MAVELWAIGPNQLINLFQYKILLYSLDGRLLSTYQAYEWSLGIKSIAWSPSSQFLAIGSYDEKVRNRKEENKPI